MFVVKHVQESIFVQALRIKARLGDCQFVRLPLDTVAEERTIIYEHMTDTLFNLVSCYSLALNQCKQILHVVLQGLHEMHSRNVVHADLKPNNVLVDFSVGEDGNVSITRIKIADVDDAVILRQRQAIATTVGNVWWRSPEAQLGTRIRAPTDIFSFGLVPILLIPEHALVPDVDKEYQVLDRTMEYFGPFPPSLKEKASGVQRQVLAIIEDAFTGPEMFTLLQGWSKDHLPESAVGMRLDLLEDHGFKRIMSKAMKMEPAERATVDELLADPWWEDRGGAYRSA
ncbi:hypothetical protein FH972_023287 [Carpinus fangiana]|uniref:Protein kinase domain-containing protein n=1 Tax=Carpinus fangiana TaxID=176857 RepID=A0A5N6KV07_9ROSI|nr:hypothetical protein FH972_023287 [Carpinus fangiana]